METDAKWVESVAASLIREFLSRKGLRLTLHYLNNELPQREKSINNRARLICELHLEGLVKKNKASSSPLRTLLEIITKDLQQNPNSGNAYVTDANIKRNEPKISHPSTKSPIIFDHREEKKFIREDSIKSSMPEGFKSASVDDLLHQDVKSTLPRGVPKIISISKDSVVQEAKDSAKVNLSIERINHNTIDFKKSKPPVEGKVIKLCAKGSPIIKGKQQLTGIHSSLELPNRQRRRLLSGEPLPTEPLVCINSLENRLGLLSTSNPSLPSPVPRKIGIPLEKIPNNRSEEVKKSLKITSLKTASALPNKNKKNMDDLEVCDFSDSEVNFEPVTKPKAKSSSSSRPITVIEACELKKLLFGSSSRSFGSEWRRQAFVYSSSEPVGYGFVQNKGGPCGILAAVQAHVLCELLFNSSSKSCIGGQLRPSLEARCQALAKSLSLILWRAGSKQKALVAIPSGRQVVDSHNAMREKLQCDGLTEQLVLSVFDCFSSLLDFLLEKLNEFQEDGKDGCILFLYSVILSRGIESVKEDMDDPNTYIIGRHGYCTQEMVNLLLVGYAASNVFDGSVELNTGGTEKTVLRGIQSPSDIGLLSLFEHYNSCKVGSYYKNPQYPIWVILSESHFSVLFSITREIDTTSSFDLFYYDGLVHQTEEIYLTVDIASHHLRAEDDLIPPLELCICTKWTGAKITWHGTEPML